MELPNDKQYELDMTISTRLRIPFFSLPGFEKRTNSGENVGQDWLNKAGIPSVSLEPQKNWNFRRPLYETIYFYLGTRNPFWWSSSPDFRSYLRDLNENLARLRDAVLRIRKIMQ